MKVILLFSVVLLTACIFVTAVNAIAARSIESWLYRAKDAGNPAQVAEFLTNYKQALYDSDRIERRYTSLFKYPGTYMPTYIRAIDGLIARAKDLSVQDATQTSYQMGLVNLEKDLGDIEPAAWSVWFASGGWIAAWGLFITLVSSLIFGLCWLLEM